MLPGSTTTYEKEFTRQPYDAWEKIARALSDIQTELNWIEQAEQQSIKR
jgi:hypothetical protein